MTGTAPAGGWTSGTIIELDHPTDRLVRLRFHVEDRVDHLPGQHYVVRLTAPDGYRAQRSYSVASAPADVPSNTGMVSSLPRLVVPPISSSARRTACSSASKEA